MSGQPTGWALGATADATDSSSRMSPTIGNACPPASSSSLAAVYTVPGSLGCGSAVFAINAMFAPSAAARLAIANPMPRLAPEMNMVFPESDMASPYAARPRRRREIRLYGMTNRLNAYWNPPQAGGPQLARGAPPDSRGVQGRVSP